METRSKTRGGLVPSSELGQVSQSLQSSPVRSSSESSLNLTVICDDGTAGVVGPSRPEVGVEPNPNIRLPASTSVEWVSAAAEVNADRKPMNDYHRDGAMTAVSAAMAAVHSRNPTLIWKFRNQPFSNLSSASAFLFKFDLLPRIPYCFKLFTLSVSANYVSMTLQWQQYVTLYWKLNYFVVKIWRVIISLVNNIS